MTTFNYQPDADQRPIIVKAYRTPIGRALGSLAYVDAVGLVAPLISHLMQSVDISPDKIDDVILGNAVGGGGNIARLALLSAGLPLEVPGVSVDRQCGSGLETIMMASRLVQSGAGECYIAGGVESVSTAPMRAERPRHQGQAPRFYERARFAPDNIGDPEMGVAAENVAKKHSIGRERQDAFALESHRRAVASMEAGAFDDEIVPIQSHNSCVKLDECPRPSTSLEALSALPAIFEPEHGTVTAGNSCPLNDGASIIMVMSRRLARQCGITEGLVFIDGTSAGVDPNLLGLGPVPSTRKLLSRQPNIKLSDIKTIEFNEAFASQVLASLDQLSIDAAGVNKQGGALALGHPFGASGSILVTRLFSQSKQSAEDGALCAAMLGIAGGLGLIALFQWSNNV